MLTGFPDPAFQPYADQDRGPQHWDVDHLKKLAAWRVEGVNKGQSMPVYVQGKLTYESTYASHFWKNEVHRRLSCAPPRFSKFLFPFSFDKNDW